MKIKIILRKVFLFIIIFQTIFSYSMESEEENNIFTDEIFDGLTLNNHQNPLFDENIYDIIPMNVDQSSNSNTTSTSEATTTSDLVNNLAYDIYDIFTSNNQNNTNEHNQTIISQNPVDQQQTYKDSAIEKPPVEFAEEFLEDLSSSSKKTTPKKTSRKHQCPYTGCGKFFPSKRNLNAHIRRHTGEEKPYNCSFCDCKYAWKVTLMQHIRKKHKDQLNGASKNSAEKSPNQNIILQKQLESNDCNTDSKTSESNANLNLINDESIISFQTNFESEMNAEKILEDTSVQSKKATNLKTRKCTCPHCNKLFSSKAKLDVHTRLHTGVNPHKCNYCDSSFPQLKPLKMHLVKNHREKLDPEQYHRCKYPNCNSIFAFPYELRNHKKAHESKLNYRCEKCEFACNSSNLLTRHIRKDHNLTNIQSNISSSKKRKNPEEPKPNSEPSPKRIKSISDSATEITELPNSNSGNQIVNSQPLSVNSIIETDRNPIKTCEQNTNLINIESEINMLIPMILRLPALLTSEINPYTKIALFGLLTQIKNKFSIPGLLKILAQNRQLNTIKLILLSNLLQLKNIYKDDNGISTTISEILYIISTIISHPGQ